MTASVEQPYEDNTKRTLSTQQARQGVTLGRMRFVLTISLVLIVAAFTAIYIAGP